MNGLIFITHRTEKYDYLQSVEIALQGGCRQIQLRMKETCVAEVEKTALLAKTLCDEYGASLFVNDHVAVCLHVNASGVHLGKSDMSPSEARALLSNKYIIGETANTFDDILHLNRQGVDYVGLGPYRFTETKKKLSPVLGLEGYRKIMHLCKAQGIHLPVFAIGGITLYDIPEILKTGVAGIALSSAILHAENPLEEMKTVMRLFAHE